MQKKNKFTRLLAALGLGLLAVTLACNSKKTSSGSDPETGGQFVATEDNSGGLRIDVNDTTIPVAGTSRFKVCVFDANGGPVPNINVFCDTEVGLALIEPTRGFELTDRFGCMSGEVGCTRPGSFQMACRLPVGVNRRKFEGIKCAGSAPAGFTEFPDSGGGGLGGGVDVSDDAQSDSFGIRISSVSFRDGGQENTLAMDIVQDQDCDPGQAGNQAEPFTDTEVFFEVANNSTQVVRLVNYRYIVRRFDGRRNFTSTTLNFIGDSQPTVDPNGARLTVRGLFADAIGRGKRYAGMDVPLVPGSLETGFKNVDFVINAVNSQGDRIELRFGTSISVDNFDRCN